MRKILFFATLLLIVLPVFGQEQQLPYDSAVKFGKLNNGLTYYIRKNGYVPGSADFYIVQNVGSILEKPEQRGLAHFLEHMAFNGTKHFPDKQLINYLETIGVKFGANLNAYTSVDETVYHFTKVPVSRPSVVDSCLLILRDWSDGILLENDEIDKERGVIEEEWRTRDNHMMRMYEQIMPVIYKGTKYEDCMPIGSMDVVRNFKPEVLRAYYKEWYRPDLQAIVVVGDIDVDYTYKKLVETFADAKVPENPSERIWYQVSDNKEPIIVTTRDKENTYAGIMLSFKHDPMPAEYRNTALYLVKSFINNLIERMIDVRFDEIMQTPESPFIFASAEDCEFLLSATKRSFEYYAGCSDQNQRAALVRLLEENERIARYGFTQGEFERAKIDVLKSIEKLYNEREKLPNGTFAKEYIANFTQGEPFPGLEAEFMLYKQISAFLQLDDVNSVAKHPLDSGNVVLWMYGTEVDKVDFPSKEEVLALFDSISTADIAPYVDNVKDEPLVGDVLPGTVKSSVHADGVYHLVLSNGVQVDIKPTTLKEDEVLAKAVSVGGISSVYKKGGNPYTIKMLNDMISIGGMGNFSTTELGKALAGKNVSVSHLVGDYTAEINGTSTVNDLETMMQLIYLGFTSIRKDEAAYQSLCTQYEAYLRNMEAYPAIELSDSVTSIVYGNHPIARRLKAEDIKLASYDEGLGIARKIFSNAADFKFAFTGNINMEEFVPLVCKYIASLPAGKAKSKAKDIGLTPSKSDRKVSYRKVMENPKTTVKIYANGKMSYTLANKVNIAALDHILDIVYFENVREKDGGTYGVRSEFSIDDLPFPYYSATLYFDTDSAKYEALTPIILAEIENIAKNGPRVADLQKTKEYFIKTYTDAQVTNQYWLGAKEEEYITGLDIATHYVDAVNALTVESVRNIASAILKNLKSQQIIQVGVK
ncbi:MAG: insulinase family protein [Paludibacteraceae bacterium]|nr:insulinase family protein [Paludibacteraceae bacterium]